VELGASRLAELPGFEFSDCGFESCAINVPILYGPLNPTLSKELRRVPRVNDRRILSGIF
jgi:hypothetical protein